MKPMFLCVHRFPEHVRCHASLSTTPSDLQYHAACFSSSAGSHDVYPACRSVTYIQSIVSNFSNSVVLLLVMFLCRCLCPPVGSYCSHSNYGSSNSCSSSYSCAWSPSIQVCCRSPQPPTAHDCSATGQHAAGMNALFFCQGKPTQVTSCAKKFILEVHSKFTVWKLIPCISSLSLLCMCRDRSLWLPPCWLLLHHRNRSRCWVSDSMLA